MKLNKPSRKEQQYREQITAIKSPVALNIGPVYGLLVFLTGFLLYANTLSYEFALDDYSVIIENRLTRQGFSAVPEIFTTSYRYGYFFTDDLLYRPLTKAMFAVEWSLSPANPFPGHLMNVLLFALTGCILFRFLFRLTEGNTLLSFVTAMLFMTHPIHTEVVANIKSRDEILALLGGLAALDFFLHYLRSGKLIHLAGATLLYFLALLSKESAITFLAVFPLAGWWYCKEGMKKVLIGSAPMLVAALVFLLIRASVLKDITTDNFSLADNHLVGAKNWLTRFSSAVYVLGLYMKLLIFPHPLVFDYSFNQIPLTGPGQWKFLLSIAVYIVLLGYALVKIKTKNLFSFAILFYLITLSVSSNIFITIGTGMAERLIYTPSLGFCLAVGLLLVKTAGKWQPEVNFSIKRLPAKAPFMTALLVIVLAVWSVKLLAASAVWKSNYTLYQSGVEHSPNSTRTHYYLGNYLVKPEFYKGKGEEETRKILRRGITSLHRSIEIYPRFSDPFTQLGVAHFRLNNNDSALYYYNRSATINPQNATVQNNIGTVYFAAGKYQESLPFFLEAVRLNSAYSDAHMNVGSVYGTLGNYEGALESFFLAGKYDPGNAQVWNYIGITYRLKGDVNNAKIYLEKAYGMDPTLRP